MRISDLKAALATGAAIAALAFIGGHFALAAIQGDFGVVRRAEVTAEKAALTADREKLRTEIARMQNLTRRLSDDFLDLDLLDERVRNVLGYVRTDEIVIR